MGNWEVCCFDFQSVGVLLSLMAESVTPRRSQEFLLAQVKSPGWLGSSLGDTHYGQLLCLPGSLWSLPPCSVRSGSLQGYWMAKAAYTLGSAGGFPDWEGGDTLVSCLRVKQFSWA